MWVSPYISKKPKGLYNVRITHIKVLGPSKENLQLQLAISRVLYHHVDL